MSSLLSVEALTHSYSQQQVLDGISLDLKAGEILSLLGPNAAGKSTLLKIIAGVLPQDARSKGKIRFEGEDVSTHPLRWRASRIAYVGAELAALFPMTAEQAVLLGRSCQGAGWLSLSSKEDQQAVERAMRRAFCWELRDRDLQTLSGGERQLVALARSLAQGARVLLFDEALSRMDLNHQSAVGGLMRELASQGYGIVVVSHDVNVASEWAHSALLLKQGRCIANGPIHEVLTGERVQTLYPGARLVVAPSPSSGAPKVFFQK